MNAQHKVNRINNRIKRLARRLIELENDKAAVVKTAAIAGYEPDLSDLYKKIKAIKFRIQEIKGDIT